MYISGFFEVKYMWEKCYGQDIVAEVTHYYTGFLLQSVSPNRDFDLVGPNVDLPVEMKYNQG